MKIEHDNIVNQISQSIPEHQILLSFNNDLDAVAFYRWWKEQGGRELFMTWAEQVNNPEYYSEPIPTALEAIAPLLGESDE